MNKSVAGAFSSRVSSRGESGAVLLEAAGVMMLLLIMSFGAVEYGMLLRNANEVADSVRSGTRRATVSGDKPTADYDILRAMKSSKVGLGNGIDRVVVFRSASANGKVPPPCLTGKVIANSCNVYEAQDFDKTAEQLAMLPGAQGWPPAKRKPGVDYVGVYVHVSHPSVTTFFQKSFTLQDAAVIKLGKGQVGTVDSGWKSGTALTAAAGDPVACATCGHTPGTAYDKPPGMDF